ncbi:MAG: DNA pilot protein [Arizlama microvirus]|nr:MAG: DNA pilot protein [Arizlama microvirus]
MWPAIIGGAIAGIGSMIGAGMSNTANAQNAQDAGNFNAAEAAKNRDWQQQMSNSAYQRQVTDMKQAGLNPMLSANMSGASSPSGSMGSMQAARMENVLGQGISSAMESRRLKKELDATDSQISLNKAYDGAQKAQMKQSEASAKVAEKNAQVIDAELPAIRQKAKTDTKINRINEKMATTDAILNRTNQVSGIINNAASALKPSITWKNSPRAGDILMNRKGEIKREW